MIPLTRKQRRLLDYLRSCEECPSFEEMKLALGLKSKSGVHRLIGALEERGYIRRAQNRARAIELIETPHLPDNLAPFSTRDLALEARRRGPVLGEYHRTEYRVGEDRRTHRYFVEISV